MGAGSVSDLACEARERATAELLVYMRGAMERRRAGPGDDLISHLLQSGIDGVALDDDTIERMLMLQLIAGIDTTWSSIGAALWHLATHDEDRRHLAGDPSAYQPRSRSSYGHTRR